MGGCSVRNCKSSSYKRMRLFRFPRNETRCQQWAQICQRENWYPGRNDRICSLHFTEDQFESARVDGWKKLKPNAVPTIFKGTDIDKSNPRIYVQKSQPVFLDHSYSSLKNELAKCEVSTSINSLEHTNEFHLDFHIDDEQDESEEIIIKFEPVDTTEDETVILIGNDQEKFTQEKFCLLQEEYEALKCKYNTLQQSYALQLGQIEGLEDRISQLTRRLEEESKSKKQLEEILHYITSGQKR